MRSLPGSRVRRMAVMAAFAAALLGLIPPQVFAQQRCVAPDSRPSAPVGSGRQPPVTVAVPAGADGAAATDAVPGRVRADGGARARAAAPVVERLTRAGILKRKGITPLS